MEEELLKEYVGTYLNPKYNRDWDIVNSKFPELSGVDKQLLKEYVGTYLNPKYNGDWNVVNSKFPELFTVEQPKKKEDTVSQSVDGGSEPTKSDGLGSLAVQVQDESILTKKPREAKIGESRMLAASESTRIPNLRIPQKEQQPDEIDKKLEQIKKISFDEKVENQKISTPLSYLNIFSSTIANLPADVLESWAIASSFIERQLGKTGFPGANPDLAARDLYQYQLAEDWRNYMDEIYPTNQEDRNTFLGGVFSGLGQAAPMVLSGGISLASKSKAAIDIAKTALNTGTKLTPFIDLGKNIAKQSVSPAGLIGGSQMSSATYRDAIESGASEDQAQLYAIENFFVGTVVESLPVQSMFSRISKIEPTANILRVIKDGVVGASEEALTEMWQTTYENWSAKRIYDFNREMLDGVGDAGAVGGTVGFLLNSSLSALLGRRARVKNEEEAKILDKSIDEIKSKINIVNKNNENISSVAEELDSIEPIVLNYGDSKYFFTKDKSGRMELAEEPMLEDQAKSMSNMLGKVYKGLDFSIEEVRSNDPYTPVKYNVVARETETKPIQEDAVQKQAAGQVPVQPTAGVSQEVAQGEPQAEPQVVTQEGQKEIADENVILSGLRDGFKAVTRNSFDIRSDADVMQNIEDRKSFTTSVTKNGKKYLVVGLKLKDVEATTSGRDGYSFAVIEDDGNLPSNAVDVLTQKAVSNVSSVYPNIKTPTIDMFAPVEGKQEVIPTSIQSDVDKINEARKKELDDFKGPLNQPYFIGDETGPTVEEFINQKYDTQIEEIKAKVVPQEELDLETKLAEDLDVIKSETKPRLRVEGIEIPAEEDIDVETIETNLDRLPSYEVNFTTPTFSQDIQVNPIEESKSQVKEGTAETRPIESFEGVPMVVGMSDILAAGKVTDSMGNPMDVEGGLLYNVLGKNKNAAWAGVTQKGAQTQYNEALQLYKNNKNLFEKLWAEGKLPNGHVPMAIMKMADTAVNSNEAVYRYLNPLVKSQPEANQKAALDALKGDIEVKKKVKQKAIVKSANKLGEFISKNNISSLGQLLDTIIVDANNRAKGDTKNTLSLTERSLLFDLMISPQGIKEASKNTVNALFGSKKDPRAKAFLADTIYNDIAEPSMMKTPKGNIVAVVGIDVLNGGVIPVEHGNYGFGPKGQMIALISNPKHGLDVFPEWKAKATRVFKKSKGGAIPSEQKIADEVGGAFYIDKAFRGAKVSMEPSDIELLSAKLRFSFPDVTISNSKEEFDRVLQEEGVRTKESGGKVILGMTKDGKVYLNPESDSLATPIHEFGHIWIDFLRSKASGKKGDALLSKGLSLVEGTKALQQAIAKYGDNALAREEALVELMATKGETIINKSKQKEFKNWLNALFKYIKEFFITSEQLFKGTDFEQKLKSMSLDDFINIGLADLLKGKEVSSKFKAKEAGKGAAELRFRVGDSVQNFINKARAQGYSEAAIKNVLTRSGVDPDTIDAALAKAEPAAKKIEVTEEFAPGYDRVFNNIFGKDGIIAKSRERGVSKEGILENAINYLRGTKVYENATDVQREAMERNVNKELGKREKAAPSAKRVLGQKKDVVTVTVDLAKERDRIIKEQIKLAKEVTGDLNTKRKALAAAINKLAEDGKITAKKAETIAKRALTINLDSEVSVNKFIDYVSKVFADANYASKLSEGNAIRKKIRNVSKNKDKSANLRDLGVKFSEIDPSMVEDIDQYNEIASKILKSIEGSSLRSGVKFAEIVKIADVSDYINTTIEKQRKEILKGKIDEMSELLGIEITEEEYFKIIESINNNEPLPKKYKDGAIRKAIDRAFNVYSAIIDDIFKTGKDPVTGEEVSISDKKKKVVKDFMSMDLNLLSDKEALAAIDSLLNFIQNGSTAKMSAIYNRNLGEQNAIKLDKKNFRSSKIKKYFSENLGQLLVEQFTQLDLVIERMFKGFNKAGDFMFEAGISALKKGKSMAQSLNNKIVDNYFNTFYKSKPNGKAFNTIFNTVERGMTAYMMRTMPGTESEINTEFNKKKSLIEQSIVNLNKGNDKQKELASVYTEVYDKLIKDSDNYDDVVSKADPKNVEAVRFWQNEWANKYEGLSDLSESIYNKTLGRDLNYTPVRVSNTGEGPEIDNNSDEMNRYAMSFHINNQTTYQRETGVLMTPTLDDKLSKGTFIDLSFDRNNANSMYDALIDLNTADAVRQIAGFFNSDSFENIIQNGDDKKILKGRVNLFIRNIRNKNPYDNDEFAKAIRGLQNLAALGAGRALAGPTQAVKQTVPVIVNTVINAGRIDLTVGFNKDKNDFINNSGYAIANRSAASNNQIESVNKLAEKTAKSLPSKIINPIADPLLQLNELQLKIFLQKPDAYVARASWISYYEKSLRQQGIDTKSIDYATHQINDKAADYAQRMVDRQQNLSDMDLAGKFVGSKNPIAQFVNKTVMPFSSFRINQSARLGSDWAVLTSKVSTAEDRVVAARSLGGFFSEMVTFRAVSATIAVVLASVASLISGIEDDEEDREKLFDMTIKGATTSTIIDIVSFLPYMDGLFQAGIAKSLDVVQDMLGIEDADKFPFYDPKDKSWVEGLGMLGIALQRTSDLIDLIDVAYTRDYKDDFGRTKYITQEDADILKEFVLINILSSVGIASPEIKTMTRRTLANVKRKSSTNESGIKREKGSGTRSSGSGAPKTINKTDMKKYFPDMYNELYGPGSATYEIEQEVKALEKEQRKMEEQIKKEIYGGS